MNSKTPFTEDEIEQLNELYMNHGIDYGISKIEKLLKEVIGLSNVHKITTEIRKFRNKESTEMWNKYHEKWQNSTLDKKLMLRISEDE